MPDDFLMRIAWADCLFYCIGNKAHLEAFSKQTGNNWIPAKSGIDRMIDEATGADFDYLRKFVVWFNENIWGDLNIKAGE